MTDKPTPTDAELFEVIREAARGGAVRRDGSTSLRIARAVLAKWGQPAQARAGAVPLTPDQVAEIADAAHREYDRLVSSGQCAPRWSAVFAHLLEMHHGIKGGQNGADT